MLLPKTIDPIRMATRGAHLEGKLSLNQCARLQDICDQEQMQATVSMDLNMDTVANIPFVRGNIIATINAICQRCNARMTYPLAISFQLSPVTTEMAAKNLPKSYEPLILETEKIDISDIIEDEILLALPMVTKHADGEC